MVAAPCSDLLGGEHPPNPAADTFAAVARNQTQELRCFRKNQMPGRPPESRGFGPPSTLSTERPRPCSGAASSATRFDVTPRIALRQSVVLERVREHLVQVGDELPSPSIAVPRLRLCVLCVLCG